MKTCTKCGAEKELNQFLEDRRIKDGKGKVCIACLAAAKGYTQFELEDMIFTGRYNNTSVYYDHREREISDSKEYIRSHPESSKISSAKYHKENPQVHRESSSRRRARLAGAKINDFTEDMWEWLKEKYESRCAYCGNRFDRLDKDHVIPLSGGGNHTLSNIVPSCRPCNLHKNARTPEEAGISFALYVNVDYDTGRK